MTFCAGRSEVQQQHVHRLCAVIEQQWDLTVMQQVK